MSYEEADKLLAEYGWTLECWSPLEIRHTDGSFATLNAAQDILDRLEWQKKVVAKYKKKARKK